MKRLLIPALLAALGGCTLDPLVEDEPGASVHILPYGSDVPYVGDDPELVNQITVHDGLDDGPLAEAGGVIARQTGWAGGVQVKYWSFGNAPRLGAAVYVIMEPSPSGWRRYEEHPYLLDSMPGEPGYSPFRRIHHVRVTGRYDGELLTTMRALEDAIELGLVEEPVLEGYWFNLPVVPPGTTLEIGGDLPPLAPERAFAGGYQLDYFRLGGDHGVQPLRSGSIPIGQVSTVREAGSATFKKDPIFQFTPPFDPPTDRPNYSALSQTIEVDLAPGVVAAEMVHADADLYTRSMTGGISGMTPLVTRFTVTTTYRNLQQQFYEGEP